MDLETGFKVYITGQWIPCAMFAERRSTITPQFTKKDGDIRTRSFKFFRGAEQSQREPLR